MLVMESQTLITNNYTGSTKEVVILLHGLGRTSRSMVPTIELRKRRLFRKKY